MRRKEINSITAFMLCLAIVLSTALPMLADTPPSPPQPAVKALEKVQCSGEFVISVKSGTGWKEAGKLVYALLYSPRNRPRRIKNNPRGLGSSPSGFGIPGRMHP